MRIASNPTRKKAKPQTKPQTKPKTKPKLSLREAQEEIARLSLQLRSARRAKRKLHAQLIENRMDWIEVENLKWRLRLTLQQIKRLKKSGNTTTVRLQRSEIERLRATIKDLESQLTVAKQENAGLRGTTSDRLPIADAPLRSLRKM